MSQRIVSHGFSGAGKWTIRFTTGTDPHIVRLSGRELASYPVVFRSYQLIRASDGTVLAGPGGLGNAVEIWCKLGPPPNDLVPLDANTAYRLEITNTYANGGEMYMDLVLQ